MIRAIDLTKRYADGTLALEALNLEVAAGEIYCLVGAHGSGKSTTLDIFLGLVRPTAGRALVHGVDACREPSAARRHVAYLMGGLAFYEELTALRNLEFFARLGGRRDVEAAELEMAMREVSLPERSFRQRVRSFNAGMRQKLGLAAAILKGAPALLLDEPTAGLEPQAAAEIGDSLRELRDAGRAILLATQDLFHARQIADRVGLLKEGRKVLSFSRHELRHHDLEALYLDYMRGGLGGAS